MIRDEYIFSFKVFPKEHSIHVLRHLSGGKALAAVVEFITLKQGLIDAAKLARTEIENDAAAEEITTKRIISPHS